MTGRGGGYPFVRVVCRVGAGLVALLSAMVALATTAASAQPSASTAAAALAQETQLGNLIAQLALGGPTPAPFVLHTPTTSTLVLPERPAPYTLADISGVPGAGVYEGGGAFLLDDNVFLEPGAVLDISSAAPFELRMRSGPSGFTWIVSFGGVLDFSGTPDARLTITSWDPAHAAVDPGATGGRSYIRSIAGSATLDDVNLDDLGFGNASTSGVAIEGPDPALGSPSQLLPAQPGRPSAFALPPVTASVRETSAVGNAVGLYVSTVVDPVIAGSTLFDCRYSGLYMGHFVTGAVVEDDLSAGNLRDGFEIASAVTGSRFVSDQALGNASSGFALDGLPVGAVGPASQSAATSSNDTVSGGRAVSNGSSGIDVSGGQAMEISSNYLAGNPLGIYVHGSAQNVTVDANRIQSAAKRGVELTDGVTSALVEGNTVTATATAIYLRGGSAVISGNSIHQAHLHAISLVGLSGPTRVTGNVLAGRGKKALDVRTPGRGLTLSQNDTSSWTQVKPPKRSTATVNPVTAVWLGLFALTTVMASIRRRKPPVAAQPRRYGMRPDGMPAEMTSP